MTTELSTTLDPRDLKRYYFHETRTRRVTLAIIKSLAWFIMKYELHGSENLPAEGPVVLASNHVTTFDVFPMTLLQ